MAATPAVAAPEASACRPAAPATGRRAGTRSGGWPTPLAFAGAGLLLVTSRSTRTAPTCAPGRYDDLADLASRRPSASSGSSRRSADPQRRDRSLSEGLDEHALDAAAGAGRRAADPAGLRPVEGPGLTVTLDDAPEEVRERPATTSSNAIVHQQDIQAVVNALWAGGAEAMTIQGQRVVSTTGIKCVGNTVMLHGVPYSPPYAISAIGDADAMRRSLDASPYIRAYLEAVDAYQLGWDVEREDDVEAPAYDGSTEHAVRPRRGWRA